MYTDSDRFDHRLRQTSLVLYAVATLLPVILANAPGWNAGINRTGVNLLAFGGLLSLLFVRRFPWHRYDRNLFLVMSFSSAVLAALAIYLTGGSSSPFNAYFFLMVVFCALYYSRTVALAVGALITLASLLPLVYEAPTRPAVVFHLVVAVSSMTAVWVGSIMATELVHRERVRRLLEEDLSQVRRLQEGLAHRTAQLEAVHDIGRELVSILDPDALCRALVAELRERFHYGIITLFLLEETTGDLVIVAAHGLDASLEDVAAGRLRLPAGVGVSGHVAGTRRPFRSGDVRSDPRYVDLDGTPARSELAVPLVTAGTVLGVLNVESEEVDAFDETDVTTLEAVADQAAVTLGNARAHVQLSRQAATDALTGLLNYGALVARLDAEVERARRSGHSLSVLYFDADRFKQVNDTYGHAAGDAVLAQLALVARETLRSIDAVGRYGGEEFAAILPLADHDQAMASAERLRAAVRSHPFALGDGAHGAVAISVGVATYGEHGTTREELLRAADSALYRAKRLGRDRVCSPEPEHREVEPDTAPGALEAARSVPSA